jgi:hypothetical protein
MAIHEISRDNRPPRIIASNTIEGDLHSCYTGFSTVNVPKVKLKEDISGKITKLEKRGGNCFRDKAQSSTDAIFFSLCPKIVHFDDISN